MKLILYFSAIVTILVGLALAQAPFVTLPSHIKWANALHIRIREVMAPPPPGLGKDGEDGIVLNYNGSLYYVAPDTGSGSYQLAVVLTTVVKDTPVDSKSWYNYNFGNSLWKGVSQQLSPSKCVSFTPANATCTDFTKLGGAGSSTYFQKCSMPLPVGPTAYLEIVASFRGSQLLGTFLTYNLRDGINAGTIELQVISYGDNQPEAARFKPCTPPPNAEQARLR